MGFEIRDNLPLLLFAYGVPFVIAAWVITRFLRKISPGQKTFVIRVALTAIIVQVALSVLFSLRFRFELADAISMLAYPANVIGEIAVIVAGIAVIRYWRPDLLGASDLPFAQQQAAAQEAVESVIRSDRFLNALNETLPVGAEDAEHGLDYIPYLLQAIRYRRDRFEISARRFLRLTLALGVITAIVVGAFGWVLLDEFAVGAPRALHDVRNSLDELTATAGNLVPDYRTSTEFAQLQQVLAHDPGTRLEPTRQRLLSATRAAGSTAADLDALVRSVTDTAQSMKPADDREKTFKEGVTRSVTALGQWQERQRDFIGDIERMRVRLARLIPLLEAGIGKDEARLTELVRRLAIGLIVSTFFLALVRFVASLYRHDYKEALRADLDDMFIRSFYVAFKASGPNSAQRASVLAALTNAMAAARAEAGIAEAAGNAARPNKHELEILKEIVSAAAKKL